MTDHRTPLERALMREADRRAKLGHHATAHDLRRAASDVAMAVVRLASSKTVRRP